MNDPFEKSSFNQFLAHVPILPPVFCCFQFFFCAGSTVHLCSTGYFLGNILENLWKKSCDGDFFLVKLMVAFNFIEKGSPLQVCYCKCYEIFHHRFFTEHLRTAASTLCILLRYHARCEYFTNLEFSSHSFPETLDVNLLMACLLSKVKVRSTRDKFIFESFEKGI